RVAAADAVHEVARPLRGAQPAVLLLEPRGEGRLRGVLGHAGQRVDLLERAQQESPADGGEAHRELARGLLETDRCRLAQEHAARIHARIHLERGDAGLGLAADYGPRDRRGAAVAW